MYRVHNRVMLNINYTYRKLTFKCVARTSLCMGTDPLTACSIAGEEARKFIEYKLKELNPLYSVKVLNMSYSHSLKYKFKGLNVPECTAKASFAVLYNGEYAGHTISIGLIQKLIENNNNYPYFEFSEIGPQSISQLGGVR